MRSQQEAERAEQQRIKSLVLNYDLNNSSAANDADGHENGTHKDRRARKGPSSTAAVGEEDFFDAASDFHYVFSDKRRNGGGSSQPQLVGKGVLNDPDEFDYRELKRIGRQQEYGRRSQKQQQQNQQQRSGRKTGGGKARQSPLVAS